MMVSMELVSVIALPTEKPFPRTPNASSWFCFCVIGFDLQYPSYLLDLSHWLFKISAFLRLPFMWTRHSALLLVRGRRRGQEAIDGETERWVFFNMEEKIKRERSFCKNNNCYMVTYSLASGFSIHPAMIFVKKDIGGVACGRWWRWCIRGTGYFGFVEQNDGLD